MSLLKQLEILGADAEQRYSSTSSTISEELQTLIDTCPDVVAFLAPAEEEAPDSDETPQEAPEEEKSGVRKAG